MKDPRTISRSLRLDDGRLVAFSVRRSSKARYLRLNVCLDNGLEVALPPRAALESADAFVREKKNWVLKQLQAAEELKKLKNEKAGWNGRRLMYRGEWITVVFDDTWKKKAYARKFQEYLVVFVPSAAPRAARADAARGAVEAWMAERARERFEKTAAEMAPHMGVRYSRIIVRNQKSQWGSCSMQGSLSFNWRLIMAPHEILEYIAIHELAHLRHPNHGPRFWALVRTHCPDFKERERWLAKNGALLSFP